MAARDAIKMDLAGDHLCCQDCVNAAEPAAEMRADTVNAHFILALDAISRVAG